MDEGRGQNKKIEVFVAFACGRMVLSIVVGARISSIYGDAQKPFSNLGAGPPLKASHPYIWQVHVESIYVVDTVKA